MKHFKFLAASLILFLCFTLYVSPAISSAAEDETETIQFSSQTPYYLYDGAGLFSESEFATLEKSMKSFYDKEKTYVAILTTESITGTRQDFLDSFYSTYMKKGDNAVLLLINMDSSDRGYEFLGFGKGKYSDSTISKMQESLVSPLKNGEYLKASQLFLSDSSYYMNLVPIYLRWWVHLLAALLIAGIVVFIMVHNAGGKVTTTSNTYLDSENSRLIGRRDIYMRTTITRTKIERNTSSSSSKSGGSGGGGSF